MRVPVSVKDGVLGLARRLHLHPALLLGVGTALAAAAGGLLVEHLVVGLDAKGWDVAVLVALVVVAVLLIALSRVLDEWSSQRTGYFLQCVASRPWYQRSRFEDEERAFRQWSRRLTPLPRHLPRLEHEIREPGDIASFLRAVGRDLAVAFAENDDVRRRVHLLVQGAHEANFWLGWHLSRTIRRSKPLTLAFTTEDDDAIAAENLPADGSPITADGASPEGGGHGDAEVVLVTDQQDSPGENSHEAVTTLDARYLTAVLSRRADERNPQPELVSAVYRCRRGGAWAECSCEEPHRGEVIVAVDPEVRSARVPGVSLPETSPRMVAEVEAFAQGVEDPLVLWVVTARIESTGAAYAAFAEAVIRRVVMAQEACPRKQWHLAYTGPVGLTVLFGAAFSERESWDFLAFDVRRRVYSPVTDPLRAKAPGQ